MRPGFNEPVEDGGPTFGPSVWAGDAIVTGDSRGKLYRTTAGEDAGRLRRRPTVVVACEHADGRRAASRRTAALVVACHSGRPDWGSGPTGRGKLYKITYTDRDAPAAGARVAGRAAGGARRVRPAASTRQLLRDVLAQTKITAGQHVRAGDRFETLWPPYAVVQAQKVAPRTFHVLGRTLRN